MFKKLHKGTAFCAKMQTYRLFCFISPLSSQFIKEVDINKRKHRKYDETSERTGNGTKKFNNRTREKQFFVIFANMVNKDKVVSFLWQHVLLLVSLFIMTLGVAVCVRSNLGSSVISTLPYVFEDAGRVGAVPRLTIGQYTYILNALLVVGQILVLRSRFEWVQLFQVVVGFVFGSLIDVNMLLTSSLQPTQLWSQALAQVAGCTILGTGIAFEICCGSVTMPGEGFPVAISQVTGTPFYRVKIFVDCTMVMLAVLCCYVFFGQWQMKIIGPGTLFAMFYVGWVVSKMGKHLGWFERLLAYRPGFRRYIFGLARHIYRRKR